MKPMLAADLVLEEVNYPVLASPKLDGIRCVMIEGRAKTKKLELIPNRYVRKVLDGLNGLDGELIMPNSHFDDTTSALMSIEGEPEFEYHVFDNWLLNDKPFSERHKIVEEMVSFRHKQNLRSVSVQIIHNEVQLLQYLDKCVDDGYEGIVTRNPEGIYKDGKSTVKQGFLLKLKPHMDTEGVLVRFVEMQHNMNPTKKDKLGYTKRSSSKVGKIPAGTAGSCILNWEGEEIKVGFGKGFTKEKRQEMWDNSSKYIGKTFKFKYQEVTKDGQPRFGKLLGERHPDDSNI